jgi:hypothetical protein
MPTAAMPAIASPLSVSVGCSFAALLTEDGVAMAVRSLAIAACGLPRRKIRQRWSAKYQGGRASSVAHSPAAGVGRILIETQRGASNRSRPPERSETHF